MTQTATPWWAEVQHLRPDENAGADERTPRTGRFDRRPAAARHAPAARVERRRHRPEPEVWLDAPAAEPEPDVWLDAPAAEPKPEAWFEAPVPEPKPERRTIEIRGQADRVAGVAPVPSPGPQRIRGRRADERVGPRPDKVALWAVLLGLLLILVALVSSPGADAAAILLA